MWRDDSTGLCTQYTSEHKLSQEICILGNDPQGGWRVGVPEALRWGIRADG